MKICVAGKDGRFECLKKLLIHEGHEITNNDPDLVITNYPFPEGMPGGKVIAACGPKNAPDGIFDLMKDEEYLRDVAYMTAEGAVASAMMKTSHTIKDSRCLVVGWGRIGRALCALLHNIGAKVRVTTRRRDSWPEIESMGGVPGLTDSISTYIGESDVIFSTPPAMVIGRIELENARRDAAIIDLASPPYGVNLDAARELGVNAWREPALPGRYCPENAARAIYSALMRGGVVHG